MNVLVHHQPSSFFLNKKKACTIVLCNQYLLKKIKYFIDHKVKTMKYTSLKSSGIGILQYTESVSLPKSIQSCKQNVQADDIYGFK